MSDDDDSSWMEITEILNQADLSIFHTDFLICTIFSQCRSWQPLLWCGQCLLAAAAAGPGRCLLLAITLPPAPAHCHWPSYHTGNSLAIGGQWTASTFWKSCVVFMALRTGGAPSFTLKWCKFCELWLQQELTKCWSPFVCLSVMSKFV